MLLGVLDHLLDLLLGETRRRDDPDALLLAGAEVLGADVDDAVRVDVERHLDLRHAARRRRNADQLEARQRLVVRRHVAFALQDVHVHDRLVVDRGGEHLRLARRDGGVLLDDAGIDAAGGLHAERERRDVEQQDVLHLALEHASLDGRADGNHLVGVHSLVRLLAEEVLHHLLDLRHPRHAAHQDDAIDPLGADAPVLERDAARLDGLLHQVVHQLLELAARHRLGQVLGPGRVRRDERQVHVGLGRRGELVLGALRRFLQALQRHPVPAEVDVRRLLELVVQGVDDPLVEVLAAEEGVAVGGLHLEDAGVQLQDRDVEGASAEVVDGDLLRPRRAHGRAGLARGAALRLVETVRERRRGRLVDDAQHVQSGDAAGVLGSLALAVVEIGGDGDHRLRHLLAEIVLGGLLHLRKDHRGDLRGAVPLPAQLHPGVAVVGGDDPEARDGDALAHLVRVELAPDQALDGEDGSLGIGDGLSLGDLAHQALAGFGEAHHRGSRSAALGVRDYDRFATFHHRDAAVGGAEIDPDDLGH